jgi:serine/threonine protein kinase/tetratricopeptide (TPR) repeat protein
VVCPRCGANAPARNGLCAQCGTRLGNNRVAAATLTPAPPVLPTPPGDRDETRLAPDTGDADARPRAATGMLAPGDPFGPRYRILRMLGAGGMGIVYHAWDEELGVAVALKVIRPEVSADPTTARELEKRFKRELLLARQVTHHNVVRIHDIGEVEGTKYITMSFIEGRDLATELAASGHLPVPRALHLVRQLAEGLQAAHEAGVIHRDLKPANIMVEGDSLAIMDFGIARSAVRTIGGTTIVGTATLSQSALATGATMQGAIVGTVAYMSPEQAKGQPADQRSDIYAVGMILRDMLIGVRPVVDPMDAMNDLMARVERAPTAVKEVDPAIPDEVDRIVTRCLQPEPAARYQSVRELLGVLNGLDAEGNPLPVVHPVTKRLVAGIALVVMVLIVATWWLSRSPAPPVIPDPVSVLIADFENKSGDPVFDGAVEQALSIAMEGASFVTAYPRRDALALAARVGAGNKLDEATARVLSGREGIKYVLAGAIVPRDTRFELSVRAVDPATGEVVKTAAATARDKAAVLQVIASLAAEIREALGDTAPESARLAEAETFTASSLDAMAAYSRGQALNAAGKPAEALTAFQQAVRHDPAFGRAYINMASIYTNLKQDAQAKAHYELALKHLDRMTAREKYRTLGVYYLGTVRDYQQAIDNFELLVKEYPADNMGHANLALAYVFTRNLPRAMEEGKKATEIYPRNLLQRTNYATYAMYAGDFATARAEASAVLKENPKYEYARLTMALSTLAMGSADEARQHYAELAAVSPLGRSLASMGEADLEMYFGRHRRAIEILQTGIAADGKDGGFSAAQKEVALGEAYLETGDRRLAAAAAARAARLSDLESILYPAARVLIAAGQSQKARELGEAMEKVIPTQTRSYGRLVAGALALDQKRYPDAVDAIREGLRLHDSWMGHALLGEAYTAAGQFAQALAEWELCLKRRGEATDAFFADTSTLRYLPPVHYSLGRVQEALGATPAARASYEQFLKLRQDAEPPDARAAEARRRLAAF